MTDKKIEINYKALKEEELPETDRELVRQARGMTYRSYAPYSKFHVGAAILMENGEIARGSNQENAAYPSGTCAERTACYHASAVMPGVAMKKIAVAARNVAGFADSKDAPFQPQPISPCGACRQALIEYENLFGPIEVILYGADDIYVFPSVKSLLPFCFTDF